MLKRIVNYLLLFAVLVDAPLALSVDINGQLKRAQFEKLSSAPTGTQARVYFDTTELAVKVYNGTSWTMVGGSGGSGEINVIENPNDANAGWAASGAGVTVATSTTASDHPLAGVVDTSIKCTPVSGTDYCRYRWTMPPALENRKLKVEWHQKPLSGYATGDFKVEVYKNSASNYSGSYTEFALSTDSSGTSSIPNQTGKYTTTFDADDGDYYELRIVRTAGTTALNLVNVVVGPGIQAQGGVVTSWQTWPTSEWEIVGASNGSVCTNSALTEIYYTRRGEFARARGYISFTGAPGTCTGAVWLRPSSSSTITINTTGIVNGRTPLGEGYGELGGGGASWTLQAVAITAGTGGWIFADANDGDDVTASNPATIANGDEIYFDVEFRVGSWADSGTMSVIQDETLNEWQSYTPTGAWSTNVTWTGKWRRTGDMMDLRIRVTGSGNTDAANFSANLPTGYTIDSTKLLGANQYYTAISGNATMRDDSASGAVVFRPAYNGSSSIALLYQSATTGTGSVVSNTSPVNQFTTNDYIDITAQVPITEWRGKSGGGPVGFAMADTTYAGLLSASTSATQQTTAGKIFGQTSTTLAGNFALSAYDSEDGLNIKAGSTASHYVQLWENAAGSDLGYVDGSGQFLIHNQPRVEAYNSGTDTITSGAGGTVEFDTEVVDVGSIFNTTTDTFTAPVTGNYMLCTSAQFTATSVTRAQVNIVAAGVNYYLADHNGISGSPQQVGGCVTRRLDSGQTATVTYYSTGTGTLQIANGRGVTWFTAQLLN